MSANLTNGEARENSKRIVHAAGRRAGRARRRPRGRQGQVATVCAACHGAIGVSVSDTIPNLAAQRTGYLEAQLKALKDGSRKSR